MIQLQCNHINFATSMPALESEAGQAGTVVDNALYNFSNSEPGDTRELLPDLKTQIGSWLEYEEQRAKRLSATQTEKWNNITLVALSFGMWDIWYSSRWNTAEAEDQIALSLDVMFQAIDVSESKTEARISLP